MFGTQGATLPRCKFFRFVSIAALRLIKYFGMGEGEGGKERTLGREGHKAGQRRGREEGGEKYAAPHCQAKKQNACARVARGEGEQ